MTSRSEGARGSDFSECVTKEEGGFEMSGCHYNQYDSVQSWLDFSLSS